MSLVNKLYFYKKNELLTVVQMSYMFLDTYYKRSKHYSKMLVNMKFWEMFSVTGTEKLKFSQEVFQNFY